MNGKETIKGILPIAITVGVCAVGSVFAFSSGTRAKILERDGNRCVACGSLYCLEAAHRNHNKRRQGYNHPQNGTTLCTACHLQDHLRNEGHNGLSIKANREAISHLKRRLQLQSRHGV